jgi:hypothetical protein
VNFVDVVDLEPGAAGAEAGVLPELADGLDAVVAGTVDLDDVDVLPDGDRLADVAHVARALGGSVHTIEALGEDPGNRRLADSARAGEEIRVRDAVHPERIAERLDDVVLSDHVLEGLRPVPTGDDRVTRGLGRRRTRPIVPGHEASSVRCKGGIIGRESRAEDHRPGRRPLRREAGRAGEVLPGT